MSAVVYEGVVTRHTRHEGYEDEDEDGGGDGDDGQGQLFAGQKLWFSHAVPQRARLMQEAEANGATIVQLDKQADIILVDHARKQNAPGTYSYQYVERSIRNGRLENLDDHAVGAATRADRPVGSVVTAPKRGRCAFTEEEDQFLWNWMKPFEEQGGSWKGLAIYKQIENARPRHTYQSWRDRWMKIVRLQKRPVTEPRNMVGDGQMEETVQEDEIRPPTSHQRSRLQQEHPAPTASPMGERTRVQSDAPSRKRKREPDGQPDAVERTPPLSSPSLQSRQTRVTEIPSRPRTPEEAKRNIVRNVAATSGPAEHGATSPQTDTPRSGHLGTGGGDSDPDLSALSLEKGFTLEEAKRLYKATPDILNVETNDVARAWQDLASAREYSTHTAAEWRSFFESTILPEYYRRADQTNARLGDTLTCIHCFTTETTTWRRDKKGRRLCDDCGQFLKLNGFPRPSTAWTEVRKEVEPGQVTEASAGPEWGDVGVRESRTLASARPERIISTPNRVDRGVQTSPIIPEDQPGRPSVESPSFELRSVAVSRPPEPNEARKRSGGRNTQSNSQESHASDIPSHHLQVRSDVAHQSLQRVDKHDMTAGKDDRRSGSPELPEVWSTLIPSRKIAKYRDEPGITGPLEIPSTPELIHPPADAYFPSQDDGRSGNDNAETSPTLRKPSFHPERSHQLSPSPLFFPERDDRRSLETLSGTIRADEDLATSPLSIQLLGELEIETPSPSPSSAQPSKEDDESGSEEGSESFVFETAHESSTAWETAPEQRQPQETARTETQALFNRDVHLDLSLELPEPDGGWENADNTSDGKTGSQGGEHHVSQDDNGSKESLEVDSWLAAQMARYPNLEDLESILHMAIEATSFDFEVADEVVKTMIEQQKRNPHNKGQGVRARQIQLPRDARGCWTEEDDNLLFSQNTREVDRIIQKHGPDGVDRRYQFLEIWLA